MSKIAEKYIIIGRFGRPHGIHGLITIRPESDNPKNILKYQKWLVETKTAWQNIDLSMSCDNGEKIIAKIKDIDTREEAKIYSGKKIAILRNQLSEIDKNEYYWTDLEGLKVFNQDNKDLGKIDYLIRTGGNDIIVTKGDKRHLIPFIKDEVIKDVDFENQIIKVNWDAEF